MFYPRVNSSAFVGCFSSCRQLPAAWLVAVAAWTVWDKHFDNKVLWPNHSCAISLWGGAGMLYQVVILSEQFCTEPLEDSQTPEHCKVGKSWTTLVEEARGIPCAGKRGVAVLLVYLQCYLCFGYLVGCNGKQQAEFCSCDHMKWTFSWCW